MVAGVAMAVWGARALGPALTPGPEPLPGVLLVTRGAYAHVRHPIYLGVVLFLTGYTLGWSNWTLAAVPGILSLEYFEAKARVEERRLAERPPACAAYMRHVPRRVL